MGWNMTEIAGKLVGSGLFVYGFTEFIKEGIKAIYYLNSADTSAILNQLAGNNYNLGIANPAYEPLPLIFMVIGLTLLFIKYPESK
ncbi:MAG: hypothetical protein AABX01_05720 [Candidatus Micrarchaeota archaeon]